MFGIRKKTKVKTVDICEKAKELQKNCKKTEIVNMNSDIIDFSLQIKNDDENLTTMSIRDIEKTSPLTAYFIKEDICKDLSLKKFDIEDEHSGTFVFKTIKKVVRYFSLDPMKAFKNEKISISSKEYDISNVSQSVLDIKFKYKSKSGREMNIEIPTSLGILDVDNN